MSDREGGAMANTVRLLPSLFLSLSLSGIAPAGAEIPVLSGVAVRCTRSATLLHCDDGRGGHYGMARRGNDLFLRGYDAASGLFWAQTSTRFGRVQFFSGVSSDGNLWIGMSRQLGWNVISRFSTSAGDRGRVSCNRLKGCD
ncbi:hypothetical protein AvCA_29230 [Azotobacter vinelandii CA]|uniref:Glutamine synthetase n=3 Tax=Azotobacter group TaxID=351 RepID=C1DM05_AZOVD|nr:conserved hypothetical protein [Azotobacter vinelandii DJ]AGK16500.1 hypothetical protein AvCA_29230 [Azotobacter vinelandii CA]AGK20961.1 hypothetical protein AvCA6_29230 [Azotobacter vinelandii CA6]GLK59008.1 hypothetical protein GCM10017624_11650 [Azotobacter vinelandii]